MTLYLILVYDVTKRESFSNLADVWTKEIEANSTNKDCIKMLVGNKVDKVLSPRNLIVSIRIGIS